MAENSSNAQTVLDSNLAPATPASLEDTEAYIEAYHAIAEWIRFADAKAGVVLAVAAALAGLLVPTVKPIIDEAAGEHLIPMWKPVILGLFGLFILFLLLSGVFAFGCILPFRVRGRHPALGHCNHFHPAAISQCYGIDQVEKFTNECNQGGVDQFRDEVIAAILLDSHISSAKYRYVTRSIRMFAVSALFAFFICWRCSFSWRRSRTGVQSPRTQHERGGESIDGGVKTQPDWRAPAKVFVLAQRRDGGGADGKTGQ